MEIERKFRVKELPEDLGQYPVYVMEQAYLCTNPVVRIRKSNEYYYLTYKSKFGIDQNAPKVARVNNEVEVPLNEEGFHHLKQKADDQIIYKRRYMVPLDNGRIAELDIFGGHLEGLVFAEVEFEDEEQAKAFVPPSWFGDDVSFDYRYSNSFLSKVRNRQEAGL